jgi:acyl carrier protein
MEPMDRVQVVSLIAACFKDFAGDRVASVDETTALYGKKGIFDSMQLVTFLLEVEQQVNEAAGSTITIADDRALSQERSPFRTIGTLADYVTTLLAERHAA